MGGQAHCSTLSGNGAHSAPAAAAPPEQPGPPRDPSRAAGPQWGSAAEAWPGAPRAAPLSAAGQLAGTLSAREYRGYSCCRVPPRRPGATGPVPLSQPWRGILPAGRRVAREGLRRPGAAGRRAGPGPPAPRLPGSRPGPGSVLSGNGRWLCAGIGSEVEGVQVSKGCGVGEGRAGRGPLEQKQRCLPGGGEKRLGGGLRRAPGDHHHPAGGR